MFMKYAGMAMEKREPSPPNGPTIRVEGLPTASAPKPNASRLHARKRFLLPYSLP